MLLVDTNVLLAAADTSTREHERCAKVLDEHDDLAATAPTIATLNRRDFAVVRPAHVDAFELIP